MTDIIKNIAVTVIAAGIGTVAFSILFAAPKKFYIPCGIVGAVGWLVYSILLDFAALNATESTFFATAAVILLSRCFSVWKKAPVTIFLIPGIFPLVPGAGLYWTAYYMVTDRLGDAITSGTAAIKACLAIVLGIVAVFELPNKLFHHKKHPEIYKQN